MEYCYTDQDGILIGNFIGKLFCKKIEIEVRWCGYEEEWTGPIYLFDYFYIL